MLFFKFLPSTKSVIDLHKFLRKFRVTIINFPNSLHAKYNTIPLLDARCAFRAGVVQNKFELRYDASKNRKLLSGKRKCSNVFHCSYSRSFEVDN